MFGTSQCFLVRRPTGMDIVLYLTDNARHKIVPGYLKFDENCCYVFTVDCYIGHCLFSELYLFHLTFQLSALLLSQKNGYHRKHLNIADHLGTNPKLCCHCVISLHAGNGKLAFDGSSGLHYSFLCALSLHSCSQNT